jgi:hypothetical protein
MRVLSVPYIAMCTIIREIMYEKFTRTSILQNFRAIAMHVGYSCFISKLTYRICHISKAENKQTPGRRAVLRGAIVFDLSCGEPGEPGGQLRCALAVKRWVWERTSVTYCTSTGHPESGTPPSHQFGVAARERTPTATRVKNYIRA